MENVSEFPFSRSDIVYGSTATASSLWNLVIIITCRLFVTDYCGALTPLLRKEPTALKWAGVSTFWCLASETEGDQYSSTEENRGATTLVVGRLSPLLLRGDRWPETVPHDYCTHDAVRVSLCCCEYLRRCVAPSQRSWFYSLTKNPCAIPSFFGSAAHTRALRRSFPGRSRLPASATRP